MSAMSDAHQKNPNKSIKIKYTYEGGSTVITHSLVTKEQFQMAVVHVFRFENSKIVELWYLGQVIDISSSNSKGMF
jgi:predicted SnoaL-like aldol condensation-catalyzing enzyme